MQYGAITFRLISHARAFLFSIGQLIRTPFSSLMTLAVIGVAMALPAGLFILLQNFQDLGTSWNGTPTISLYLKNDIPVQEVPVIEKQLTDMPEIAKVKYISPQKGLQEFEKVTQLGKTLAQLKTNPLPGVFVVYPQSDFQTPSDLENLLNELKQLPAVGVGQLDLSWIKRLYYILEIGKRVIYTMALLFGFGVLLIVGNTIRLALQNHRNEIAVLRLIGAKPSFIRRPLLYRGFLSGFLGGIIAWLLVELMLSWLEAPATALAMTYGNDLQLRGLNFIAGFNIVATCALLGWLGSLFAVNMQLRAPEEV